MSGFTSPKSRWLGKAASASTPPPEPAKPPEKKSRRDREYTDEEILSALRASAGLVAQAAERLGCDYSTVYVRMKSHPEWALIIAETRLKVTDIAEAHFINDVRKGEKRAVDKWLRYHAKDRGYTTRHEVSGPNGAPLAVSPVNVTVRLVRAKPTAED